MKDKLVKALDWFNDQLDADDAWVYLFCLTVVIYMAVKLGESGWFNGGM